MEQPKTELLKAAQGALGVSHSVKLAMAEFTPGNQTNSNYQSSDETGSCLSSSQNWEMHCLTKTFNGYSKIPCFGKWAKQGLE